jgi:hypothetical protein
VKKAAITTVVIAAVVSILLLLSYPSALLTNPGFESGWVPDNFYWTPSGGPYSQVFNEVRVPAGWVGWWREGFDCAFCGGGPCTFQTGRPEVLLFTDPTRVRSGNQAVKAFTFYRCHEMGLMQRVNVNAGRYAFRIYAHSWYSNCSTKPFDPPLDGDCKTRIGAKNVLKVGIDPAGGIDPRSPSVVWGKGVEQYGIYGQPLVVITSVTTGTITVFVSSLADTPLKHDDVYLDDAALFAIPYTTYVPLVMR